MLKMFLRHYGCRNFSCSRLLKNAEKDVVKSPQTPPQTSESVYRPGVSMDFVPSELQKTILVLSGRFKSKAEIPNRITFETMDNARSRFRIRLSNVLMVLALGLCGYHIWRGKKQAREGRTINAMYFEKKKIADAEKSHKS